jgi:hypothetical protein
MQPEWKLIGNLGDVNFIDYGGFLVYEDQTGTYPPEVEVILEPDDDQAEDQEEWTIHRIVLEKCTYIDGVLSDNVHHPNIPAWWASDMKSMARACDQDLAELIGWFCSDDAMDRAEAYRVLYSYHSIANGDSYPATYNRAEIEARYAEVDLSASAPCPAPAPCP